MNECLQIRFWRKSNVILFPGKFPEKTKRLNHYAERMQEDIHAPKSHFDRIIIRRNDEY